jgi:hypothetical protein
MKTVTNPINHSLPASLPASLSVSSSFSKHQTRNQSMNIKQETMAATKGKSTPKSNDTLSVKGFVSYTLTDKDGNIKNQNTEQNLVMSAGKNFFCRKILGDSAVANINIAKIAFGSGNTPPAADDVTLVSQLTEGNIAADNKFIEGNIMTYVVTFGPGDGTGIVREVGLLNNASPNLLICRMVLDNPFEKLSTDFLTLSWRIQIG